MNLPSVPEVLLIVSNIAVWLVLISWNYRWYKQLNTTIVDNYRELQSAIVSSNLSAVSNSLSKLPYPRLHSYRANLSSKLLETNNPTEKALIQAVIDEIDRLFKKNR